MSEAETKEKKTVDRISVTEWAERQGAAFAQAVKGLTQGERVDIAAGLRALRDQDAVKARVEKLSAQLLEARAEAEACGKAIGRYDELVNRVEAFASRPS